MIQLLLVVAFSTTFFSFFYIVSRAFNRALLAAGFDYTDIILIGLPKSKEHPELGNFEFAEYMQNFQDAIGHFGIDDLTSPAVLATAGAAAVATILFTVLKKGGSKKVLNPKEWQEFPLETITKISPNTAIYRFALPGKTDILGLPIGQHISVSANINGKEVMRSYTPISSDDDLGFFELLIKSYDQGNISKYFTTLKIGDNLRVKGPKGQFSYTPQLTGHIGMIAGGTGITPMLQIIRAALKNPADKTKLTLIYANVNHEDILLRQELEKLVDTGNKRLKVYYVLNNAPESWTGGVGFVTKDHIAEHLPKPADNCKILMCGPPPMINAMKKHLDDLKYPAPRTVSKLVDQVFIF